MKQLINILLILICFAVVPAMAANRFWVGGTGSWNQTLTGNWSTTSGGASGASAPGTSDTVVVDNNSGTGTITLTQSVTINSLNFSGGFTGTLTTAGGQVLTVNTAAVLNTGLTVSLNGGVLRLGRSTTPGTYGLLTNGIPITGAYVEISPQTSGVTYTLSDNLVLSGTTQLHLDNMAAGTAFNTQNFNIDADTINLPTTASTATFGTSTITLTGAGGSGSPIWYSGIGSATISAASSTIIFNNTTATDKIFSVPASASYGTLQFTGAGTGKFILTIVSGSITINTLIIDTPPHTIWFKGGVTHNITNWTVAGTAGNLMTITSQLAGTQFTVSTTAGTNTCNYCSIKDSVATGGATWNALTGGVNAGNNTGWNFPVGPTNAQRSAGFWVIAKLVCSEKLQALCNQRRGLDLIWSV